MMRAAPLLLLLALAGCGGGSDPAPGDLTREQNRELDQAAKASDINAMDGNEAGQ